MQRRNQELRHFTLQITNNGRDIVSFLKNDVLNAVDTRVLVNHKIAAARILARIGLEDGREYIKDGKVPDLPNPKKRDPLYKVWRSISGSRAEIYRAARRETRDGVRIMIFFNEVMHGKKPDFKPHHRLAAAKELLRHVEYIPMGREGTLPLNHGMNVWPGEEPTPPRPVEYLNADEYLAAARPAPKNEAQPTATNNELTDDNEAQPTNETKNENEVQMTATNNNPTNEPTANNESQPTNENPTIADLMTESLEQPAASAAETKSKQTQPTESQDQPAEDPTAETEDEAPEPQSETEEFTPEEIERLLNKPLISYFLEEPAEGEEIPPKEIDVVEAYLEYRQDNCLPEAESIYQSIIRRAASETDSDAQLQRAQNLVDEFNLFVFEHSENSRSVVVDDELIAESLAELAKSPDAPKFDLLRLLATDDHEFYYCLCEDCNQCDEYDALYERGIYDDSQFCNHFDP